MPHKLVMTRQVRDWLRALRSGDPVTRRLVATLAADDDLSQVTWPWLKAFQNAGRQFSDAAEQGLPTRGMRAILAQVVIFHWNRLGLPATTQAILANAAIAVHLP